MSALLNPTPRGAAPALTLIQGIRSVPRHQHNPLVRVAWTFVIGFVAISMLNLMMSIATSEGVYQVAGLKNTQKRLQLNTQILGQQVDSLSSDQNLSNAARVLGMVSNANPVFLDVNAQQVFGKPAAALSSTNEKVSGSLVANSELTATTTSKALKSAMAAQERKATVAVLGAPVKSTTTTSNRITAAKSGYVGATNSGGSGVGLAEIPASPTH